MKPKPLSSLNHLTVPDAMFPPRPKCGERGGCIKQQRRARHKYRRAHTRPYTPNGISAGGHHGLLLACFTPPMRRRLVISPALYAKVALVALAALALIVMTGAAVRMTGSGLGCPDWPKCYGRTVAPLESHAIIEYT